MSTDKLKIYNGALSIIGERQLASLTEERESRRQLDLIWDDDGVIGCLEAGQWYFAMRSQKITYDPSIQPDWGYQFVFDVPSDHVRTCALCQDEFFSTPLLEYKEEANFWYANLQTIYVRFVSSDTSYGLDMSLWPASFVQFVKADFASQIVLKISADKDKQKEAVAWRALQLKEAKSLAAMADATIFPAQGGWSRARQGNRRGWRDGGNRNSLIG